MPSHVIVVNSSLDQHIFTTHNMDEQWNDRGILVPHSIHTSSTVANVNTAIWLGHLWMQSFLGRWLFRTSTPTDQLQVRQPNPMHVCHAKM